MDSFKRFFSSFFRRRQVDVGHDNANNAAKNAKPNEKSIIHVSAEPTRKKDDTGKSKSFITSQVNTVNFVKESPAKNSHLKPESGEGAVGAAKRSGEPHMKDQSIKSQIVKTRKRDSTMKSQATQFQTTTPTAESTTLMKRGSAEMKEDDGEGSVVKSVLGAVDDSGSRSFRRLKNLSERAVRKVKTFVSRPIKESALQRFITKLEARKEAEESGRISGRELKQGDLPFPKPIQRTKSREFKEKSNERRETDTVDLKSVAQMPILCSGGDLPSGCKPVTGNKDNNGKLFIDDCQPFWTEQRKPTEADLADSDTEDVLQMNAEVALDVCDGNIKLVNMPTIPIVLDPMNELAELKRRDKLFYTRDVLFGNSVRSMINLYDSSMKATPILRRRKGEMVTFREPRSKYYYRRECVTDIEQLPFKPVDAQSDFISLRRSRKRRSKKSKVVKNEAQSDERRYSSGANDGNEYRIEKTQNDMDGNLELKMDAVQRSPPRAQPTTS